MDIKEIRKTLNLTQSQLAAKLDVTLGTISNWESGKVTIPELRKEQVMKLVEKYEQGNFNIGSDSPGAGKGNTINTDLSEALIKAIEEISAQRRLVEQAQQQVKELIELLKTKM